MTAITRMTIHRALSELKLIDSKIDKQTGEMIPTAYAQKNKLIMGYMTEEEFQKESGSRFNSILDLIDRKLKIKSAIVKANGSTTVKIAEKEMTIADAINFKAVVTKKIALVKRLKDMHTRAVGDLNKNNEIAEGNVQRLLEATFGKESVKVDKEDVEAVRKPYMEANVFHLFDPLKVNETIQAMEKEISDFQSEVDATLSEINAITFIEI